VLEQFQTDTADYADILLPVTTFLEHTDLYRAYRHYHLQLARPALAAPGEAKSNVEIFRLLARKLGFDDQCFDDSEDDMIRRTLSSQSEYLSGITLERLEREHLVRLPVESRQGNGILLDRYPLEFVSAKNDDSMNSTFGRKLRRKSARHSVRR
jgi:anaerobic selenocysteine-containing dehydrogenase